MEAMPRPRILVADDNPAKLAYVCKCLAGVDADLVRVENGAAALEACRSQEFAVVILDISMPGLDGYQVARELSADAALREVPIIFQTATYCDELSEIRGYGAGAVDYLTDPIRPAILESKARVFVELYRGKQLARYLAGHDPLTGLPNRLLFMDRLQGAMQRAERQHASCALACVDLDDFKPVNDRHGHDAGDALLKAFAQRLLEDVRKEDTVARVGGDEFALILEQPVRAAEVLAKLEKTVARLRQPYRLECAGRAPFEVTVGASVGLALYPDDADSVDALMRAADRAMYAAKAGGKGRSARASRT